MNGRYRLKITESDFIQLRSLVFSDSPKEAGAFALAGFSINKGGYDVLVRRILPIDKSLYRLQTDLRLEISTRAVNGLISLCEKTKLGAVLCHSHPNDSWYSASDDFGEKRIFQTLKPYLSKNAPLLSLLFTPNNIHGRIWSSQNNSFTPLDSVLVVGRHLRNLSISMNESAPRSSNPFIFDRQILAFGIAGQTLISSSKVGVVGVGGIGSSVAEQLVRMGVEDLILVDPDVLDPSNLSRVYGSFPLVFSRFPIKLKSHRKWKVDVVESHLKKINPQALIRTIPETIVRHEAASALLDRDVIFLCTDEHWGRSIVNLIAYQYLIPVINLGMAIGSIEGEIRSAAGVIDILRPGKPCLWCSGFLNSDKIQAESMPKEYRDHLSRESYILGASIPTPSVISMTTAIAGMGVTQFLQITTGFMGNNGDITRLNYDLMEGSVRRGITTSKDKCICKMSMGFGDLIPLPVLGNNN
jgi:molybdopterin/thiamine biosynthesis adenylyltransferase